MHSWFKKIAVLSLSCASFLAFADTAPVAATNAPNTAATPALNYTIIPAPKGLVVPKGKILVYDFFSYGCPHCYHLSPSLAAWLKANASHITPFKKMSREKQSPTSSYIIYQAVPVSFEAGWDTLAKAYHIAETLGVEENLHQKIFDTEQNPLLGFGSDAQLRSFFLQNGVKAGDYDKAANAPDLAKALKQDADLMKEFQIVEIPCVVIANGKQVYYISNRTVKNADPKLFVQTLTQLTDKRPG